jgi:hypothetical protein
MPEAVIPPLLYLREAVNGLELVRSEGEAFTADPITEKQAAALIRDLSQWLYRRIQE